MKKDVLITLVGTQNNDGEKDKIELITEGSMYKKGDAYYITYKESELTGMDGTTTTVKVQDKKVTILRFGTNNTQLIFEKGRKDFYSCTVCKDLEKFGNIKHFLVACHIFSCAFYLVLMDVVAVTGNFVFVHIAYHITLVSISD